MYQLQQLPWQPWHFQQYSLTAHLPRVTIKYVLQVWQATSEFISPDLWPLNLNLVDYKIWGCLQQRVYQKRHRDVDDLKPECLVEVCQKIDHTSTKRCFTSSMSHMRF